SLQIIDISIEKERAIEYQIVVIPTLIRVNPSPWQTIVGDLTDTKKVLQYLDIHES
ncbi:MAG: circadian clock protein KaiB, partial [Flavobacterium sp.]